MYNKMYEKCMTSAFVLIKMSFFPPPKLVQEKYRREKYRGSECCEGKQNNTPIWIKNKNKQNQNSTLSN